MYDFPYTILRLPIVYGLGDKTGLTPRIMAAAIYKHLGEVMKLLWNCDLKTNTVHVQDVCRAIWFVSQRTDTIGQVLYTSLQFHFILFSKRKYHVAIRDR